MLPFPGIEDVDGKGDGIATGPTLYDSNKCKRRDPHFWPIISVTSRAKKTTTVLLSTFELCWANVERLGIIFGLLMMGLVNIIYLLIACTNFM